MIPLHKIFDADRQTLSNIEELIEYYSEAFMIDTELRQIHFFAQIREEVSPSFKIARAESLNYKCDALTKLFAYFKKNQIEANRFGRCYSHAADQEAIANRVYANRIGNGDIQSGDGWRTRGRGAIQLTGTSNYKRISNVIKERTGITLNFYENPDLLLTPVGAILSAMAFWYNNKAWEKADTGSSDASIDSVTRIVNRYTQSYIQRRDHFRFIQKVV